MHVILLNAGLPMIVPTMAVMIYALVPIILLEAFCYWGSLGVTFWNALKSSALANLFSTLIGIPVTWILLMVFRYLVDGGRTYYLKRQPLLVKIALLIWEAPWMFPRGNAHNWIVYASGLILIVPFFFASWFSEYWIAAWLLAPTDAGRAVRNANLLSYFLLAVYVAGLLFREQRRLWRRLARQSIEVRRRRRAGIDRQRPGRQPLF